MNWNEYFFEICDVISKKSKDPSTKVGCLLVSADHEIRATGFNGFARNVRDTEERLNDRQTKYKFTVHSELNAILSAARSGVQLEGCSMYCQWFPCFECAKAIIQAGIRKVYVDVNFMKKRDAQYRSVGESSVAEDWNKGFQFTREMFEEAEVQVFLIERQTDEEKSK